MEAGRVSTASYEFGDFRFEPSNGQLLRGGVPVSVEPKALRVLEVLIEYGGRLVDRDTLLDQVWGRTIVTSGTLTRLIAELRRVLDDNASDPRYIGTVHTRGYRWLAEATKREGTGPSSGLPERMTRLVGRAHDLANLERIVSAARLVTLIGPGGAGKTQLALEFGRRREQQNPTRVAWIDLTTATDSLSCHRLVASAMDAHERADLPLDRSIALVFGEREMLIIFDNCERVVGAVGELAKMLLARCPAITILCTSQATLEIPEETLYWVTPLSLPPAGWDNAVDPLSTVRQAGAVELFIERAHAVVCDFTLDAANAPLIVEICSRLDGLPLALELAAARLVALSPQQLLAALDDRFAVLARQVAVLPPRHRSLQGAIEWSYGLLEPSERELLDLLGVFAGSWSIEAGQALAGCDGCRRVELLNRVQVLVQRSLLAVERGPHESRYRLLDSVGAFVRARLTATGRDVDARTRHAEYFVQLATAADAELLKDGQLVALERLRVDWTNVIAAYEWARSGGKRSLAAELAAGLRWFFCLHGRVGDAMHVYRNPNELTHSLSDQRKARLFNAIGLAQFHWGDFDAACSGAAEAARYAAIHDQQWELAFALGLTAWAKAITGQGTSVDSLFSAAIEASAVTEDPWLRGFAQMGQAWRAIGAAQHAEAVTRLGALSESFGPDRLMPAIIRLHRALQLFFIGRHVEARQELRLALRLFSELPHGRGQSLCCELMAYLVAAGEEHELAARLLGAASASRAAPLLPPWIKPHNSVIQRVREALGAERYERAAALGRRSALIETIQLVEQLTADEPAALP